MSFTRTFGALVIALVLSVSCAAGVTLEQMVSRENASFQGTGQRLTVGQDGKVYIISGTAYLMRMNADGSDKMGFKIPLMARCTAVNSKGLIAVGCGHMSPAVNVLDTQVRAIGKVREFINDDKLGWGDPADLTVGASGDFYVIDQHRNRILRIKAPQEVATVFLMKDSGVDMNNMAPRIRVVESLSRFYIATLDNQIHAVGFDGKKIWSIHAEIGGHPPFDGEMDSDEQGNVYTLERKKEAIQVYGPDGKPKEVITLKMGDRKGLYTTLAVTKDEVFVKRQHVVELFQVYDRKSGELKRVVNADSEGVRFEFPIAVWTAGQPLPVTITHRLGTQDKQPSWPVQIAMYNDPQWQDLPVVDGKITPPADAAGLYMVRVGYGTCKVQTVVQIRKPGSRGTVSVMTPANRVYFGRGEEIPVSVYVRGGDAKTPSQVTLQLQSRPAGRTDVLRIAPAQIKWNGTTGTASIALATTAKLAPGRYMLTAVVDGMTVAPQPLVIGPGLTERPVFSIVQGGDGAAPLVPGGMFDAPTEVALQMTRAQRIGMNMIMDRVGGDVDITLPPAGADVIAAELKKDPIGVAPQKAMLENVNLHAVAARGAFGVEEQGILIHMDSVIPVVTKEGVELAFWGRFLRNASSPLVPYTAFRGWSWACNWWIDGYLIHGPGEEGKKAAKQMQHLRKQINESGRWDAQIEPMSEKLAQSIPVADTQLNKILQQVAPGKLHAVTGPYRQPGILPPVSMATADEVDLFIQAEQIQIPYMTPHNVDFYKRQGKRAFGHVETQNDEGTGLMVWPTMLAQAIRGADGTGWEGPLPAWNTSRDSDVRTTGQGVVSTFRAMNAILKQYGPWMTTLSNADQIVIVVSSRMMRLDQWDGPMGGRYFERMYESYTACHFAHRPASFAFSEDLAAGKTDLKKYKAVLVVGQTVELEEPLAKALRAAQDAGVSVLYDGSCREEHVRQFKPLGVTFNMVENDRGVMNEDDVYRRFSAGFKVEAQGLVKALGAIVEPVAVVDNPEIMLTERRNGEGRFVWMLNNDLPDFEPAQMWRLGLYVTNRVPQVVPFDLKAGKDTVYDVFAMQTLKAPQADMRNMPAKLYAILPGPIESLTLTASDKAQAGQPVAWGVAVKGPKMTYPVRLRLMDADGNLIQESFPTKTAGTLTVPVNAGSTLTLEAVELISGQQAQQRIEVQSAMATRAAGVTLPKGDLAPVEDLFGPHLRDTAVSADGATVLINAMNWDDNYYLLDARNGAVKTQGRIGHHFAYGPVAAGNGFFVQGYDLGTAEGYHLYDLGADGKVVRRFANYGVPQRMIKWMGGPKPADRMNNFVVSPKGDWIASAGSLGLVVWAKDGKVIWSDDWWKTTRQRMSLLVQGDDTLITLSGQTAAVYKISIGESSVKKLWDLKLMDIGIMQGGAASADGHTVVCYSDTEGGRIFVIHDGKLAQTFNVLPDSLVLSPDGQHMAMVFGRELQWYSTSDGVEWSFMADDYPRMVRLTADGAKMVFGTDIGSLYVLDNKGHTLMQKDMGAWPVATWLDGGELMVTTWMGDVVRLGADGSQKWKVHLQTKGQAHMSEPVVAEAVPTIRMTWGNALDKPEPLTDNLLVEAKATIRMGDDRLPPARWAVPDPKEFTARLTDGQPTAPDKPWLIWHSVSMDSSGWTGKNTLQIESDVSMQVDSITFVEDPKHPESWLRDMVMQVWDPTNGVWVDCQTLLSDSAVHTHRFAKPYVGPQFRFYGGVGSVWPNINGMGWPVGNIRLGEIVFHGKILPAGGK